MSTSPDRVEMTFQVVADLTIVRFEDGKILDDLAIADMGQRLLDRIDKHGCRKMLLNFENVGALSSAAIGKLIHLHKRMVEEEHGQLVMCAIKEYLLTAFRLLRLEKRFTIVADEAEAMKLF